MKDYYVYILSNYTNSTLYIGVTNDLVKRVYEHKSKVVDGFTKRYNVGKLVYYEMMNDVIMAIEREKQLKSWSRQKKLKLICEKNPMFYDLYDTII